ncbi:hypothetical protein [Albidovulum sp.]
MALRTEHELHRRRSGRNLGLGLVLGVLAALIFGLSVVKISHLKEGKLPAAQEAAQ